MLDQWPLKQISTETTVVDCGANGLLAYTCDDEKETLTVLCVLITQFQRYNYPVVTILAESTNTASYFVTVGDGPFLISKLSAGEPLVVQYTSNRLLTDLKLKNKRKFVTSL